MGGKRDGMMRKVATSSKNDNSNSRKRYLGKEKKTTEKKITAIRRAGQKEERMARGQTYPRSSEESWWTLAFILVGFVLAELNWYNDHFHQKEGKPIYKLHNFIKIFMFGNLYYVWFMLSVDVPMYLNNWISGANLKSDVGGVLDGSDDGGWLVEYQPVG